MIRFLLLWLAEYTDRVARLVTRDDCADQLATAEAEIEVWEVKDGQLIDRRLYPPVTFLDEYALAMSRHPAGRKRRT